MKINKVYCDMCKREIDTTKEEIYFAEITKYYEEPEEGELIFYEDYYESEGRFDLCEDCTKTLLDQLKGDLKNGK